MLILVVVMGLTAWLYVAVPKGFFPRQDSGQIQAGLRADQSVSFQVMQGKLRAGGRHHPQGPRRRHRGRLHRRRAGRRRLHVRQSQALGTGASARKRARR
jgi:hypothetical protein